MEYVNEEERSIDREFIFGIEKLEEKDYQKVFEISKKYTNQCNSYLTGCNCNCEINNIFNNLKKLL